MNHDDPLSPSRRGIDEEDMAVLGLEDRDEDAGSSDDPMVSADDAETYMAPTDPPLVPGGRDGVSVAQGFAATSDSEEDRAGTPSDEETTRRVVHLLRTDAATSDLALHVQTKEGVVHLSGLVKTLDDSDLAEEVAGRVSGVVDVVDEMTVQE